MSSPAVTASALQGGASPSLWGRLRDLLLGARLANLAVVSAIVIGFFHGWLKLKIRHPIATFMFDIPLIFALLVTARQVGSLSAWFPPGQASRALKAFYVVIVIWFLLALVLPWGATFLGALAAVRGWTFATLMFGLGYHIIASRRQLHSYFLLIIVLAAATAVYATRQTVEEVEALRALDPYFAQMTLGQGYLDDQGQYVLRRFSTFISSGAFGGTMAVTLLFLAALLTDRTVGRKEKMILLGLALIIGWGMNLSGARSAVLAFGIGLAIIVWMRRLPAHLFLLGGVFGAALLLASRSTGGGVLDRFSQLDLGTIWGRFYIVWAPGVRYLLESGFLGGGLGKAMVGYPVSLARYIGSYKVWGVDGDLGKAMAELGIVGVVVVAWVLFAGVYDGVSILRRRRDDMVGTLGLGAVAAFTICVITFPIGSPFLGIPLGVLSWFFLGAVIKLDQIERPRGLATAEVARAGRLDRGAARGGPGIEPAAAESPGGALAGRPAESREHRRFLFQDAPAVSEEDSGPPANPEPEPEPEPGDDHESRRSNEKRGGKRFLFE